MFEYCLISNSILEILWNLRDWKRYFCKWKRLNKVTDPNWKSLQITCNKSRKLPIFLLLCLSLSVGDICIGSHGGRVEILFTESFSSLEIGLDVTFCSHHPFFGSIRGFWMEEVGFFNYVKRANVDPVDSLSFALTPLQ